MQIPLDDIRENGNLRHVPPPPGADEALTASISAQGVLQPVLVRVAGKQDGPPGYVLVAGGRRLRCAREAGLTEIPAEVQTMTDGWALAAQAAENMVRAPLHPVDQWRAVRDLVAGGFTLQNAAGALGLDDRQIRRMERLGMLDPAVLAWIEAGFMPGDFHLHEIARAPRKMQAAAMRAKGAIEEWNGEKKPSWSVIGAACRVVRFKRSDAIFDVAAMPWEQDLFAQPGADDEYTTTDGETFLTLQRQALESQITDAVAKKQRVQLAEWNSSQNWIKVPAGFTSVYDGNEEKPKRTECVLVALREDGAVKRQVVADVAATKAAAKKKAERAKAQASEGTAASAEAEDDSGDQDGEDFDPHETHPAVAEKPGLTKAGMTMVYTAKTRALRETLRTGIAELEPARLLALMVLAWGALNVTVSGGEDAEPYDPNRRHARDIIDRLLLPGGGLAEISMADARDHVGEILARVLSFGEPVGGYYSKASGPAAEWVGAAIDADQALPRFDSEEFLKQVGGDELRRAAEAAGLKSTGTVKALRERCAGAMPDWRPAAAVFGAPAPVLEKVRG